MSLLKSLEAQIKCKLEFFRAGGLLTRNQTYLDVPLIEEKQVYHALSNSVVELNTYRPNFVEGSELTN